VAHDSERLGAPLGEQIGELLGNSRSPGEHVSYEKQMGIGLHAYHMNTIKYLWFRVSPPSRLSKPT
jgi:hypothetical protein